MRLSGAVALASLLVSTGALADDTVTVWLKNGGIIRGELVELTPDDHVTVKLATGEVRRVEWAEVDHDSLGAKKAPKKEPEPEKEKAVDDDAAHKPNAKAKSVADYVPPDVSKPGGGAEGGALVTGADGYFLQRLDGTFSGSGYVTGGGRVIVSGEVWKTVCVAPCNEAVPPGTYRIDGDGIPTSSTFTLRGYERIQVSPGNSAGFYFGRTLFVLGAIAAVAGGVAYASDATSDLATTFLIGGLGGVAVGLPLWLLSATTVDVKSSSTLSLRPNGFVF